MHVIKKSDCLSYLSIHWSQLKFFFFLSSSTDPSWLGVMCSSLLFLSLSVQSSWLQALFQCSSYFSSCPPLSLPLPSNQQHPTSSSPTSSKWALELPWLLLIWPCPSRWIGSASVDIKKSLKYPNIHPMYLKEVNTSLFHLALALAHLQKILRRKYF